MHSDPILIINIFGQQLKIYLYGVFIAVGIIACLIVYYAYTKHKKINSKVQDFGFFVALISIALGFLIAKIFQAVYDWIESGCKTFDFYGAGITAMGGFVGGAAVFILLYFFGGKLIFKGRSKGVHIREFNKILLTAPCCIAIAHAFGRIGCLMAGCCHGASLGQDPVPGGIWMNGNAHGYGYYVPTQLYEAIFLFLLFGALTFLFFKKSNITHVVYLAGYGVWRFIIEFFRQDDRGGFFLGLSPSQWQSIVFILGAAAILIIYIVKKIPLVLKDEEVAASTASNDSGQDAVDGPDVKQDEKPAETTASQNQTQKKKKRKKVKLKAPSNDE